MFIPDRNYIQQEKVANGEDQSLKEGALPFDGGGQDARYQWVVTAIREYLLETDMEVCKNLGQLRC